MAIHNTLQHNITRENKRLRLKAQNQQLDFEEIKAHYRPRLGRQVRNTTRNYHRPDFHRGPIMESHGKIDPPSRPSSTFDPPTRPGSTTLMGSQGFASKVGRIEGFPPDINIPLHPGQQYANMLYAEKLRMHSSQIENSGRSGQENNGGNMGLSNVPGAQAARAGQLISRAAQLVSRSTSVPGVFVDQGHRGIQNLRSPQAFLHHKDLGSENSMGAGMQAQNVGQKLPGRQEMIGGQGLDAQNAFLDSNVGGVQSFGLRGPVMQTSSGAPLVFGTQLGSQEMFSREATPTPTGPRLRGSHSLQDMNNMQTKFGSLRVEDPFGGQDMLTVPGMTGTADFKKKTRRGNRSNRALAQKADREFARYLDELNEESRSEGDTLLAGDVMSGHARAQVRFNLQPPSPLKQGEIGDDDEEEEEGSLVEPEEQVAWSDLMMSPERKVPAHHLNPAVFDSNTASFYVPEKRSPHLLSATRPPTQSPQVDTLQVAGRQSVPPRARPALLSPMDMLQRRDSPLDVAAVRKHFADQGNLIFGEKPGSVSSRDQSPAGTFRRTASGRRLYEK